MSNATQLPPELIPGNIAEIEEQSRQRQAEWDKKLEELHSLRKPAPRYHWLSLAITFAAGLAIGTSVVWLL